MIVLTRITLDARRWPGWLIVILTALLLTALAGCGQDEPAARPFTYVALGASDAVGIGAGDPEREGWVPRLGARLGPEARVVNLGVSGSTLAQALDEQVQPALDAEPDLITIWLVVNDFTRRVPLEEHSRDLDQLLEALSDTDALILIGNLPDLSLVSRDARVDPVQLKTEIERWNAAIARVAADHDAVVVDLHTHWQELANHPEYISADGFHPSASGYARLAEIFAEAYERHAR